MKCLCSLLTIIAFTNVTSEGATEASTYVNDTSSSFLRIIKTNDVRSQDAIYSTPALLFVGKKNGHILRCLQEDPTECEVFYKSGSGVFSLSVSGEYLYAGLYSGSILECNLNRKDSCSMLHKSKSLPLSLTVARGYLYAGLFNETILRCHQHQINSCRPFYLMESRVFSVIQADEYIYAGLLNGKLMRCSLRAHDSCTLVYTMDSGIMGFANIENRIMAVTWNGRLWNCSNYSSVSIGKTYPWDIAAYNGRLYAVNEKGIYFCKRDRCSNYGNHKGAVSIAFAYGTHQMQSRYKNEHRSCTWQGRHKCPPFVTYFSPEQRAMMEVHVKDGKLRNYIGNLVDTTGSGGSSSEDTSEFEESAAIFVMGSEGKLLLSTAHLDQLLHTSSLLSGGPVAGAGELVVVDGIIKNMTTCSKHYRPTLELNQQVVASLRWQGYTQPIDLRECCMGEDCGETSAHGVD